MARNLPPPLALRSFEAAARHLSFTRAADELHVTPAAISQQVKVLEEHLGVRLFVRLTRKLLLTEEGKALMAVVGDAFDRIAETVERFGMGDNVGAIVVSLPSYFASQWLSPRLTRFWRQHPNIDLRLHLSNEPVNFKQSDVDLAVNWGQGDWPGTTSELLMRMNLTPVCSPKLLEGAHPLDTPSDLRHFTLLHETNYDGWTQWLAAVGVHDVDPRVGSTIDDPNVVLHAAIEGQGVALGGDALLVADLATGQLVRPFELSVETGFSYYILYPTGARQRPKVKPFCDWLRAEARAPYSA